MKMGQVWPKANFDGVDTLHQGGRGSTLAVTAQNPGSDGRFGTADDALAPLNKLPISISIDANKGPDCLDSLDWVRGFYSFHPGGAHSLMGDGSVRFVQQNIKPVVYIALSTIDGGETVLQE